MLARLLILLVCVPMLLHAASDDLEKIKQRIRPVGQVHLKDEPVMSSPAPVLEEPNAIPPRTPEGTYEQYCIVCHGSGVAGAPKFRDASDWKKRMAGRTLNDLTATAIKGLNAMPAKGTCQECTEAEIKAAIEYMVSK